ncbi:RNA-directed DNA polymerase, eukaryota [Tanacetum coccineum]
MEIAQKAKIKWSIKGNENSKYFLGILNKKRNQTAIRGILVEGVWIDDHNSVKNEFLSHFKERFDRPCSSCLILDMTYPNRLNLDQIDDLERNVTKEEIKRAVWDCGTDKSSGPDGFTFGFYRRYWDIIEKDVVDVVSFFFTEGMFAKGRNASFIALIPKIQDAKVVKDFRPISLIGSLYKIIAKILANHLVMVLGDLVSEVQSAFIANRQILDGPFILNELIQWCKSKKKQTMIFKIDFEKAYDLVRWDYLDDVLEKFGFGSKWRGWIYNCLHSSKGSILVNGSPTDEFHFRRGLKQDEPLSLFLFILVMESLHLSFQNVVDEGLFKGLRMNLQKSKLLGIAVEDEKVSRAVMKMGCCTLKTPFSYLGIKVGGMMTRIKSWDEIVAKLHSRLSKWKLKTLSIRGRLTLLQSVLGSTPIYYMSMFKVPSQVLKCLEDIRHKGGLGVSSLFALNRALLLKWVWRFRYDRNSLWTRFIKALYGNSGSIETPSKVAYSSTWLNIVTKFSMLKNQGMDLLSFMKKKVGDGQDTFFLGGADKMNHNVLGFSLRRAPRDGVEMEQFRDMIAILEGVELPAMHDRWIWSLVGSGEFSVASARKFIDDHRLTGSPHKTRWVKVVPIKINVMAWKVRFDFLPTRLNLSRRGLELQSILCPNCNKEVESTSHIFFACSMVRDLYRKIASWWELSYSEFDSYDDWLDWFQVLRLHSKHRDMLEGVFYAMWWLVWNFRNKSLFDSRSPSKAILFDDLVLCSFYWCRFRCKARFSWVEWLKNPNITL